MCSKCGIRPSFDWRIGLCIECYRKVLGMPGTSWETCPSCGRVMEAGDNCRRGCR